MILQQFLVGGCVEFPSLRAWVVLNPPPYGHPLKRGTPTGRWPAGRKVWVLVWNLVLRRFARRPPFKGVGGLGAGGFGRRWNAMEPLLAKEYHSKQKCVKKNTSYKKNVYFCRQKSIGEQSC